jgi:spore cortex formation protein SpoVR/YcgB (stage V sporulation)
VVVDADELAQLRKQAGAYNRAVQEAVEAKRAAAELHVHVKALDRQREEHEASLRALRDENERAQSGEPRRRKAAVEAQPAPSEPQGELLEETRVSGVRLEWWHLVLLIVGFFALGYFVG